MYDCIIVGAGPAGMKAAELACRRGHDVTLADPGALGGALQPGCTLW